MKKNYFIGMDIGGSFAKIGLVKKDGTCIKKISVKTLDSLDWKEIILEFIKPISAWIENGYNIKGIGIGAPGFHDKTNDLIYNCENIPALKRAPFVQFIKNQFKIPVYADNDATAATVGEHLFGAGKNFKNFLMVTVGTGIGGGLILDNKVYRGHNGFAGEIGHIIVMPEGRACTCGNKGCLETYASATAIINSIKDGIKKGFITNYKKDKKIDAKLIFDKAKEGDEYSIQAVDTASKHLGTTLGGIVNLLNLEAIIIGGGVALADNFFIDKIKYYCNQVAWNIFTTDLQIVQAKLLNDAGIIGAASLVIKK